MNGGFFTNPVTPNEQEKGPNVEPDTRQTINTYLSNPNSYRRKADQNEEKNQFALFDFSAKPLNSQAALQKQNRLKPKMFIQSSLCMTKSFKIQVENASKAERTST